MSIELINQVSKLIAQQEQNMHKAGITDPLDKKLHRDNIAKEIIELVIREYNQHRRLTDQDFDDMQHNMQGVLNVMAQSFGGMNPFHNTEKEVKPDSHANFRTRHNLTGNFSKK